MLYLIGVTFYKIILVGRISKDTFLVLVNMTTNFNHIS